MISKINICNMALAHLGQSPISSLNQEDECAKRINLFYEPVRDEVLRAHNWGFATVQTKLESAGRDAQTGEFLYHYPADGLFIRRVFIPAAVEQLAFRERYDTATQSRVLAVPAENAYAEYTRRVGDETQFDSGFIKAFSLALAQDLAVTLTGDLSLAERLLQKYTLCLDEARRSNMTENFQRLDPTDAFSEVR